MVQHSRSNHQLLREQPFEGPGSRGIVDRPGPSRVPSSSSAAYRTSTPSVNTSPRPSQRDAELISPVTAHSDSMAGSPGSSQAASKPVGAKSNVSSACGPCKKAHLACDVARPCKRCVNMRKEDQCTDVPHKKRGRPKVTRPSLGEPYQRAAKPAPAADSLTSGGGTGRWRGPALNPDVSYSSTSTEFGAPLPTPAPHPSVTNKIQTPLANPELFELFTTTDFKILRATPPCLPLTGFHPNEFVNIFLSEYVHPHDRHLLEAERSRLVNIPALAQHGTGSLQPTRDTQAAVTQLAEKELMSPAQGMREPYPNQNVRMLRSDHSFDWFNVRLHLGGGLGASLWRPETLERAYLVVSLLLLQPPPEFANNDPSRQPLVPQGPPTPITPVHPGTLPSFSSFAAVAEGPRQANPPSRSGMQPPPPLSVQPLAYLPSSLPRPSPTYSTYPPPPSQPQVAPPSRRTPSPGLVYGRPIPNFQEQNYYQDPRETGAWYQPRDPGQSRRISEGDSSWRHRPQPYPAPHYPPYQDPGFYPQYHPQAHQPPPPQQPPDGARRAWEL